MVTGKSSLRGTRSYNYHSNSLSYRTLHLSVLGKSRFLFFHDFKFVPLRATFYLRRIVRFVGRNHDERRRERRRNEIARERTKEDAKECNSGYRLSNNFQRATFQTVFIFSLDSNCIDDRMKVSHATTSTGISLRRRLVQGSR